MKRLNKQPKEQKQLKKKKEALKGNSDGQNSKMLSEAKANALLQMR